MTSEGAGSRKTSLVDLLYGYPAEQFWATPYRRMSLPDHWQAQFFFLYSIIPNKNQAWKSLVSSGPGRIRTYGQPVMHPTTAFAAPFGFVGWTIPSPPSKTLGCLPSSLYTFPIRAWLGITISSNVSIGCDLGFPEFDRCHYRVSPIAAPDKLAYPNSDLAKLISGAGRSNH